jgi:uncharacterized RDD family membrane protein YckC
VALEDDPKQTPPPYSFRQPRGAGDDQGFESSSTSQDGFFGQFDRNSGTMGWSGQAPDPLSAPELFEGIIGKRVLAYVIDFCLISLAIGALWIVAFIIGIITFGLGFGLIAALIPILPFAYHTLTIGTLGGSTIGMRMMGICVRTDSGQAPSLVNALVMAILFFLSLMFPLVLVFALFQSQRRTLHDIIAQVIVVNRVQ